MLKNWLRSQEELEKRLAKFTTFDGARRWLKKNNLLEHDQSQWRDNCGTSGCAAGYIAHLDHTQGRIVYLDEYLKEHPEEVSQLYDSGYSDFYGQPLWTTEPWYIYHDDGHDDGIEVPQAMTYVPDPMSYIVLNGRKRQATTIKTYARTKLGISHEEANILFYGGNRIRDNLIKQIDKLIAGEELYEHMTDD